MGVIQAGSLHSSQRVGKERLAVAPKDRLSIRVEDAPIGRDVATGRHARVNVERLAVLIEHWLSVGVKNHTVGL